MAEFIDMSTQHSASEPLSMTCPRLRWRELVVVLTGLSLIWLLTPQLAIFSDNTPIPADYRTPYEASEDYWRFGRLVRQAARPPHVLLLGDSVIWGEYVSARDTLAAQLNQSQPAVRFLNGGVNGMHPLALTGLIQNYSRSLRDRPVLLHYNLLWMTSPERDLSADRRLSFNHPRLIPQFWPRVPSYHADMNDRLSVLVERNVPLRQWVRHGWIRYLAGQDVPRWTLEHPYQWPSAAADADSSRTRHEPIAWTERGIHAQSYDWVPLDQSLQWQAFQHVVESLQKRGNRVFVLVGPFNAHALSTTSRTEWQHRRSSVEDWLREHDIPYAAPPVLPSQAYADASHPLAEGYHELSEWLLEDPAFQSWMSGVGTVTP